MKHILTLTALTLAGVSLAATTPSTQAVANRLALRAELYPKTTPFCNTVAQKDKTALEDRYIHTYQYQTAKYFDTVVRDTFQKSLAKMPAYQWTTTWDKLSRDIDVTNSPYYLRVTVQDNVSAKRFKANATAVCITAYK